MAILLSANVMSGLMDADSSARLSRLASGIAEQAKARGDEAAAQGAMGYALQYRDKALDAVEQTNEALAQRIEEVRAEERLEQAQREAELAAASSANNRPQPAATLELSAEYLDHLQAAEAVETGAADIPAPAPDPAPPAQAPAPQAAVYAPQPAQSVLPIPVAAPATAGYRGVSLDIRV